MQYNPSKVRAWQNRDRRWTFHLTPTSTIWLNVFEVSSELAKRRLRQGVLVSVVEMWIVIKRFIDDRYGNPKAFV